MEDFIYIVVSISVLFFAGGLVLAVNPQFDAQYRYMVAEGWNLIPSNSDVELNGFEA